MRPDLTVTEVSQELRCGRAFIYQRIKDGTLAAYYGAGQWLIPADAVEAFKAKRASRPLAIASGRRRPRRNV